MGYGTETTCVEIPPHVLHGDVKFLDALQELVIVLLTLRASDNLTDIGEEHVHGTDSLAVLVLLHIEGLDLLGIVGQDYGLLEVFLDEITFMLALKVCAPMYGEFEFAA